MAKKTKQTKKMDESLFDKISRDLVDYAESIRSHQDEKQSVIDEFGKERKRHKQGKISDHALKRSVPRVKNELEKLDKRIKDNIQKLQKVAEKLKKEAKKQAPKKFKVAYKGIKGGAKKHTKKKRR